MTVTNVDTDREALTLTITAEFAASVERVWQVWADPRLLERWWGPPTYPATVVDHDLTPGGRVAYSMTGPEGDRHGGWWRVLAVDAPHGLEFEDGFADDDGNPNLAMPVTKVRVTLDAIGDDRTSMNITTTFPSLEALEQLVSMGISEGMTEALGQVDDLLGAEVGGR